MVKHSDHTPPRLFFFFFLPKAAKGKKDLAFPLR